MRRRTSIDDVLERARERVAQRDLDNTSERRLPNLAPVEKPWKRLLWFLVAIVVVSMHWYVVRSYSAPAHPGVDQNGYQVGGKMFSQTFSTGFKPVNPFTYVGWMWVMTPDGWMYPKYPLGIPVLDAICIWLAPTVHQGVIWSYFVSPACTVLASAAMFLMLRMVASSFAAVVGTILLASNPVALVLANNSNSHAAAMAFACWGILFLIWWMRYGGWWRSVIAGFLIGYTFTIRYTEGLLVLPIAAAMLTSIRYQRGKEIRWWVVAVWLIAGIAGSIVRDQTKLPMYGWHLLLPLSVFGALVVLSKRPFAGREHLIGAAGNLIRAAVCVAIVWAVIRLPYPETKFKDVIGTTIVIDIFKVLALGMIPILYAIRWREPRSYLRPTVVLLGWLIPVIALVAFNKCAMGSWTGYDTTNESEGFSWDWFMGKWDFMVGQIYNTGLFFVAPLGVAGLFFLWRKSARLALVMALWFVPGVLLYTSYYWGLNSANGVGYLRFFLTLFPPMVFCATWLLDDMSRRGVRGRDGRRADRLRDRRCDRRRLEHLQQPRCAGARFCHQPEPRQHGRARADEDQGSGRDGSSETPASLWRGAGL